MLLYKDYWYTETIFYHRIYSFNGLMYIIVLSHVSSYAKKNTRKYIASVPICFLFTLTSFKMHSALFLFQKEECIL